MRTQPPPLSYLALRQHDVSELQGDLGALGLSRLGRAEPHVLASVHAILHALRSLQGTETQLRKSPVTIKQGRKIIRKHTNALLAKKLKGSTVRIMVTLPSEAADDYSLIRDMMSAGMNCARINCAHDGPAGWARMVANVERGRKATGRGCKIFMDLSGPKIRTGAHAPGPRVTTIKPARDSNGRIVTSEKVTLVPEEPHDPERSDALSRPLPDNGVIPISADVFRRLAPGDRISLIDTRGEPTRLEIGEVDAWTARALCMSDAYLQTGLPISLEDGSGKLRAAIEVGCTHLAQVQEEILRVCEAAHVPVVWATQVLEGLAKNRLPTRAEISDVAMAERAECVMLNKGPYIGETIRTLDTILKSMQAYQRKNAILLPALTLEDPDTEEVGRSVGERLGRYRRS